MDLKKISSNIKKFRELKGLTREYISDELGMSSSGYSKIERGEVDLTISKLDKISEILEVSPSQILNFDVSKVFNINHNQNVQGIGSKKSTINNYIDENTQKYIHLLENEIEKLKKANELP